MKTLIALTVVGALALTTIAASTSNSPTQAKETKNMELGSFTVCLLVKDINASKEFYEKLDFKQVSGDIKQKWLVVQNGTTKIGLFQGLIEKNMLTFNPGQTSSKDTLKDFADVREIQSTLKKRGLKLKTEADESKEGPAHITIDDPDGNPILFDQYVQSPKH
jgi:catechol 2,3-dioxygenase-like lactoylglutathione lyase family enzyme